MQHKAFLSRIMRHFQNFQSTRRQHLHVGIHTPWNILVFFFTLAARPIYDHICAKSVQVQAPAPLSLELHEATKNTMKAKYRLGRTLRQSGTNSFNSGPAASIVDLALCGCLCCFEAGINNITVPFCFNSC